MFQSFTTTFFVWRGVNTHKYVCVFIQLELHLLPFIQTFSLSLSLSCIVSNLPIYLLPLCGMHNCYRSAVQILYMFASTYFAVDIVIWIISVRFCPLSYLILFSLYHRVLTYVLLSYLFCQ